ncbi:MAG TPA: helix-turn-helix domain-containing protein [Nostoc sp.]|uniref:helix-turn-helix domain-containing protein n=1 Tax=Nostoc sp. TaxID=1180 RepID=UPI002D68A612|nr:helix-turn-helix domain-containing protein [Nostoc sp.]HYX13478.1 helix-turn-helix domain-containing protein [Nostoc sp.]
MNTFTPNQVNPLSLPSLPLEWRKALPDCAGIYFAIDSNDAVQYIGRSNNIRLRWVQHHKNQQLTKISAVRLAWLEVSDKSLLAPIEEALIKWFDPPLNRGIIVTPCYIKSSQRKAVQQSNTKIRCRLQDLLDAQELTRSALAQETGLTSPAIRGLCENTAKRYDADTLAVLCGFFGCEMGELFEVLPKDAEEV